MTTKPKARQMRMPQPDGQNTSSQAAPAAPPETGGVADPKIPLSPERLARRKKRAEAVAKAKAEEAQQPQSAPPPKPAPQPATDPAPAPQTERRQRPRSGPQTSAAQAQPKPKPRVHVQSQPKPQPNPQPAASQNSPQAQAAVIDAIKKAGLTGRQLRMARRVAQKNGLSPASDQDAVRLLKEKGIDPFKRTNMLEVANPDGATTQPPPTQAPQVLTEKIQLPQTVPEAGTLPSTNLSPSERREQEISQIQLSIARRRRKKMAFLLTRLLFFVALPTLIAGWYFYVVATPMYATESAFQIQTNESSGSSGNPFGGLLPTQFATGQDAIAVQDFLTSRDAMIRLDQEMEYKAHFQQAGIDPIQRLDADATNEQAYRAFQKRVKIGYDPTEGVMRMEVVAAAPATSQRFSERLISYAEERVNELSSQKRTDQLTLAESSVIEAEARRNEAREALIRLQVEGQTLDPEGVIASLRSQMTELEALITEKNIELATLLNNSRPNQARVDGARSAIVILEDQLATVQARMTDASQGENSLAELTIRIQLAQADLAARDQELQAAQIALRQARTEANKQVRYLTVAVRPVAPDEATYPRSFENTILAFLIFAGIYLMISLTASILREQVSS